MCSYGAIGRWNQIPHYVTHRFSEKKIKVNDRRNPPVVDNNSLLLGRNLIILSQLGEVDQPDALLFQLPSNIGIGQQPRFVHS